MEWRGAHAKCSTWGYIFDRTNEPSWFATQESGAKKPSGMALKLLSIVEKHGLNILT